MIFEILLFALLVTGTRAQVRNVRLEITPDVVEYGQEAILKCHYELEKNNDTKLYIVKWWRGSTFSTGEFYRYSPGESEKIKVFHKDWLEVNPRNSNESQVAIKNVGFQLTGNFSCEVTTDAPLFSTLSSTKFLNVVSLPKAKPVIKTERERYERGDILKANCSVPATRPQAKLTFTVNNYSAVYSKHSEKRRGEHNSVHDPDDFVLPRRSQWAYLDLELKPQHFDQGVVHLKCSVKIPGLYENSNEIHLGGSVKEPVPARVTSNKSVSYYRIADLTILGLTLLHLHFR